MLVTFRCKGHENITLFGDVALKLLHLMGHSGAVPSAILAADVPAALVSLQQALPLNGAPILINDDDNEPGVSLKHRAIPLIALLQDAVKNQSNVMWD
jgi:hypothetical protein